MDDVDVEGAVAVGAVGIAVPVVEARAGDGLFELLKPVEKGQWVEGCLDFYADVEEWMEGGETPRLCGNDRGLAARGQLGKGRDGGDSLPDEGWAVADVRADVEACNHV